MSNFFLRFFLFAYEIIYLYQVEGNDKKIYHSFSPPWIVKTVWQLHYTNFFFSLYISPYEVLSGGSIAPRRSSDLRPPMNGEAFLHFQLLFIFSFFLPPPPHQSI